MRSVICGIFAVCLLAGLCHAQTPQPVKAKTAEQILGESLASTDAAIRQQGIAALRRRATDHPESISGPLRKYWLAPMAKAGFNDDIVAMTQTAILSSPGSQLTLEPMLRARVWALIALGRKDDALADARRFYNVCALDQTGVAVDLLVTAMQAKYGSEGEAKIRQFRLRQITTAGATEPPVAAAATQPASDAAGEAQSTANAADQLLLSIPLDEKPYLAEADKYKNNRKQVIAHGNLLLMAGRSNEAYLLFTDLLNSARTDKDLAIALERQSASMRSIDGNLARAQGRLRQLANGGL